MSYVSGIASGIDTEGLISQLMQIERRPIVLMRSRQSILEQRRDAYRDVNTRLRNLAETLNALTNSSTFQGRTLASSASDVVSGSANANALPGTYEVVVQQLAVAHRVRSSQHEGGTETALEISGKALINGVEIEITADMTLTDIQRLINEADAGVTATILNDTLVLESKETGKDNAIVLQDVAGSEEAQGQGVLQSLGLLVEGDDGLEANTLRPAQDAKFTINGIEFERAGNSVTDAIAGVTLRLSSEGESTVTVRHDVQSVVQRIRAFVDQYNSTQSFIQGKTGKDAILQGDSTLNRLSASLQLFASDRVPVPDGFDFNALSQIGISIDRNGVMSVDETKLRAAVESNPDQVHLLFAATESRDGFDGVAVRLRSFVRTYTETGTGIVSGRERMFQDQITALQDSMEAFERRLELREQNLIRQFIAMEKAMANAQTVSAALTNQILQLMTMTGSVR